jgi:hypothetical protein
LERIRKLQADGLTLAEIAQALDGRARKSAASPPSPWRQYEAPGSEWQSLAARKGAPPRPPKVWSGYDTWAARSTERLAAASECEPQL